MLANEVKLALLKNGHKRNSPNRIQVDFRYVALLSEKFRFI